MIFSIFSAIVVLLFVIHFIYKFIPIKNIKSYADGFTGDDCHVNQQKSSSYDELDKENIVMFQLFDNELWFLRPGDHIKKPISYAMKRMKTLLEIDSVSSNEAIYAGEINGIHYVFQHPIHLESSLPSSLPAIYNIPTDLSSKKQKYTLTLVPFSKFLGNGLNYFFVTVYDHCIDFKIQNIPTEVPEETRNLFEFIERFNLDDRFNEMQRTFVIAECDISDTSNGYVTALLKDSEAYANLICEERNLTTYGIPFMSSCNPNIYSLNSVNPNGVNDEEARQYHTSSPKFFEFTEHECSRLSLPKAYRRSNIIARCLQALNSEHDCYECPYFFRWAIFGEKKHTTRRYWKVPPSTSYCDLKYLANILYCDSFLS